MTTTDLSLKMGSISRAVLAEIIDDIRNGLYEEDAVLDSFSSLHDHVDANEYVSDLFMGDEYDDMLLFQNAVTDDIDAFLKRHPITVPGERCFVCGGANVGDEAGWTYMDNGAPVASCSDACAQAFYANWHTPTTTEGA